MSKPILEDMLVFNKKRRNRKSCLLAMLFYLAILVLLAVFTYYPMIIAARHMSELALTIILSIIIIPVYVLLYAPMTQRCRDMGCSGWLVLLTLIPMISLIFVIVLLVVPGNKGANKYGPSPLK